MPILEKENEKIFLVYQLVQSQYIMGPVGPISINQLAIWKILDEYGIKNKIKVFESILNLSHHMLSLGMKKNG